MTPASRITTVITASVFLLIAAAFSVFADQHSTARFAGTWNGTHNGKSFVVLKLKDSEPLSGSIATGVIRADDAGRITEVEEEARVEHELGEFAEKGEVLSFTSREDSGEITRYEMRLLQPSEAELKILEAPVQPFAISKISEKLNDRSRSDGRTSTPALRGAALQLAASNPGSICAASRRR